MGKEQSIKEIIKAGNEYKKEKKKKNRSTEIKKAMMEEDRKIEEMRKKKNSRFKGATGELTKTRTRIKGDSHWALYGQPLGLATITVCLRPPGN